MPDNNIPTNDTVFTPMEGSDIPSPFADAEITSPYADDDPAQAVDLLIKNMSWQRVCLMEILRLCSEPTTVADVKQKVDEVQEWYPMVFTAFDLCNLLEETGGIECVNEDGSPYDKSHMEPTITTDEKTGARYYQANEPDDMYWHTTDTGQRIVDDDDPVGRAQECFDEDPDLMPIYKRVLTMCAGDGCQITDLDDAVKNDPLCQDPLVLAPFFVDRLERCDAIEWKNVWQRTEIGDQVLALLDDVEDDYKPDKKEKSQD